MGRPSLYTPETAAEICERVASGETLRSICASEGMPAWASIHRWLEAHAEFRAQYARARDQQADSHADEVLDLARSLHGRDSDGISAGRSEIAALQWRAGRMAPKRWGERTSHEISGPDGAPISLDARNTVAEKIRGLAERLRDGTEEAP